MSSATADTDGLASLCCGDVKPFSKYPGGIEGVIWKISFSFLKNLHTDSPGVGLVCIPTGSLKGPFPWVHCLTRVRPQVSETTLALGVQGSFFIV